MGFKDMGRSMGKTGNILKEIQIFTTDGKFNDDYICYFML